MTQRPLKINIMTAALSPGDAIGNYIFSKARLLRELGARVDVYADYVDPRLAHAAHHSSLYQSTGQAILWFHYSIYADNVQIAMSSDDYKIMDYHGICPPHLFKGQNEHMRFLCQSGLELLPEFVSYFDRFVAHSEYTVQRLHELGCPEERVHKIPLAVDTSHFDRSEDSALAQLLANLDYLLFVGRVVPQKDILASLAIFAELHKQRPELVYIAAGSREHTPRYQQQIDRFIAQKKLGSRVLFTGQINDPALLSALFNHATFYLATSEWESFCVPLAESLFFGVPTIVQDVPPLPEVAGPAAIVVDKAHPVEAARAIEAVLDDGQRYQTLSEAAQQRSCLYTDQALKQNLIRFLKKIAEQG
jgi:glycosyltransferase involved in cell wall biosynthesis